MTTSVASSSHIVEPKPKHVIIGGGLSGLSQAYALTKRGIDPRTILVVEKESRFGGRVHTLQRANGVTIEAGAGRIHGKHKATLSLIYELGFTDHLIPLTGDPGVVTSEGHLLLTPNQLRRHYQITRFPSMKACWKWLYEEWNTNPAHRLEHTTVDSYLQAMLTDTERAWLTSTFHYPTELYKQHIDVALPSIIFNFQASRYYVLRGGVEQLIHALIKRLHTLGVRFLGHTQVTDVMGPDHAMLFTMTFQSTRRLRQHETRDPQTLYPIESIYLAISPVHALQIPFFQQELYQPIFTAVEAVPLCRIYCQYPREADGSYWFDGLPSCIVPSHIGMFIPYRPDQGICMSSYTEADDAVFWSELHRKSPRRLRRELGIRITEMFREHLERRGLTKVPKPLWIKCLAWDIGCHYWKSTVDIQAVRASIERDLLPQNIHLIGEAWSTTQQGWMNVVPSRQRSPRRSLHRNVRKGRR